jgi:hypothetical protein
VRELHARARAAVAASPDQCLTLLTEIERYPDWYPDGVRRAEVTERGPDGLPTRARAVVHVAVGPIVRDFDLRLAVEVGPGGRVALSRIPHQPSDPERFEIVWEVGAGPPTELRLLLEATLDVPRLLPIGAVGESLAQGFVEAARRELDGSSANASASSS